MKNKKKKMKKSYFKSILLYLFFNIHISLEAKIIRPQNHDYQIFRGHT